MLSKVDLDLNPELIERNRRILQAVWDFKDPEALPINFPSRGDYSLVSPEKRYFDFENNLYAQLKPMKDHLEKGFVFIPAVALDFNHALAPSAFGCPTKMEGDGIPFEMPVIKDTREIEALRVLGLDTGLVPQCLEDTRKMREFLPETISIGERIVHGPVDLACKVRGMGDFYLDLYERPELAHRLLGICTDFLINLILAICQGEEELLIAIKKKAGEEN